MEQGPVFFFRQCQTKMLTCWGLSSAILLVMHINVLSTVFGQQCSTTKKRGIVMPKKKTFTHRYTAASYQFKIMGKSILCPCEPHDIESIWFGQHAGCLQSLALFLGVWVSHCGSDSSLQLWLPSPEMGVRSTLTSLLSKCPTHVFAQGLKWSLSQHQISITLLCSVFHA